MKYTKGWMIKELHKVGVRNVEGKSLSHLKTPIITNLWYKYCKDV